MSVFYSKTMRCMFRGPLHCYTNIKNNVLRNHFGYVYFNSVSLQSSNNCLPFITLRSALGLGITFVPTRLYGSSQGDSMNVFDRNAKRIQRNRTAFLENYSVYEYLREEVGWRVADRICDVKRKFDVAVDVGCGRGYIGRHLLEDMVGELYQTDIAEHLLMQSETSPEVPTFNIHADEEYFPFKNDSLDLVVSSLNFHWVNDLPGTFKQIYHALKNDGCLIGAMFGGDTLFELRVSLQQAEVEREGGFAPHVSPFTTVQDLGNLLNRAGFVMLTIDIDEMVINYPTMFELMEDLKGMAENGCAWSRRSMIPRDTLMAAAAIYKEMYGVEDKEGVPATFEVINFIGWKPDPSQKREAKRGSGQISLKDIDRVDEITRAIEEMKAEADTFQSNLKKSTEQLLHDTEKLKTGGQTNSSDDDKKPD